MANGGRDDNASQFFITLNRADELSNKHTLFGKVREGGRDGREGGREGRTILSERVRVGREGGRG